MSRPSHRGLVGWGPQRRGGLPGTRCRSAWPPSYALTRSSRPQYEVRSMYALRQVDMSVLNPPFDLMDIYLYLETCGVAQVVVELQLHSNASTSLHRCHQSVHI